MTDTAATELKLYIDNDGDLNRQQTTSILKNLATKRARGEYKHDLAVKAFGYLADAGAKKYAKEFGSPGQSWHQMFDVASRRRAAEALAKDFETEAKLGNYDYMLPKKYQKQETSHATKLSAHTHLHEPGALRGATDRQLRGFYRDEKRDVAKARAEAARRGFTLHARKKRPSQLDREIAQALSRRGGR